MDFNSQAFKLNRLVPRVENKRIPNCLSEGKVATLITISPSLANTSTEERSTNTCKRIAPFFISNAALTFLANSLVKTESLV